MSFSKSTACAGKVTAEARRAGRKRFFIRGPLAVLGTAPGVEGGTFFGHGVIAGQGVGVRHQCISMQKRAPDHGISFGFHVFHTIKPDPVVKRGQFFHYF